MASIIVNAVKMSMERIVTATLTFGSTSEVSERGESNLASTGKTTLYTPFL